MNCINCGYERVPEEARYCPQCGTALSRLAASSADITVTQDIGTVAGGEVTGMRVSGDVIAQNIISIINQALSAADEARKRQAYAEADLAMAVVEYASHLKEQSEKVTEEPYPGLYPYELTDSSYFYGRSRAVADLLARMRRVARRDRLVVLNGQSGMGKTSLLQAGLAPRLIAEGHLPLYVRVSQRPPEEELKRKLIPNLDRFDELRDQPLATFLRLVCKSLGSGKRLFVFWDQFEEFFLSEELSDDRRRKFVEELLTCLNDEVLDAHFLLAIRADQFFRLNFFRRHNQIPWIFDSGYELESLSPEDVQEILTEPVQEWHITYEERLLSRITEEIGKDVSPASLQLVCRALYRSLEPRQTIITHQHYEDQGRVEGILRNHLSHVLDHIGTRLSLAEGVKPGISVRDLANYILVSLVERVPISRRRQRTLTDLLADTRVDGEVLRNVLRELVNERLIVTADESSGETAYELAHDSLIDQIAHNTEIANLQNVMDLLNAEVSFWQRDHDQCMSQDRLAFVELQVDKLRLNVDMLALIFRSAIVHGTALNVWQEYAVNNRLTGELADRWVAELEREAKADTAVKLLGNLSDAEVVSRLAAFIVGLSPQDQPVSLNNLSLPQRRAVTALCLMECAEAETYLRELTPSGFCLIPAGQFTMGNEAGRPDEGPIHEVWLPAFWMAISPVTVDEWQKFVTTGAYTQPRYWPGMGKTEVAQLVWQDQPGRGNHPVRNLTWYETMVYTAWAAEESGLPIELPTEAEWEKAAGWDRERNRMCRFPWDDNPDKTRCNVGESGTGDTTPVGSYSPAGDSPYSLQDMAGNVLEWTRTKYRPYAYRPDDGREEVLGEGSRVLRGGAFNLPIDNARTTRRHTLDPEIGLDNTGCRLCLRLTPPDFRK
jgi:formylglycine-generating enzyme required for sulfatase activity